MPGPSKPKDEAVVEPVPEPVAAPVVMSADVPPPAPEPVGVHHGRFTVRTIDASSDSGKGYVVFDTELKKNVDGPFRDREDAVARAAKREIRG